jgi:hypothetical protein
MNQWERFTSAAMSCGGVVRGGQLESRTGVTINLFASWVNVSESEYGCYMGFSGVRDARLLA